MLSSTQMDLNLQTIVQISKHKFEQTITRCLKKEQETSVPISGCNYFTHYRRQQQHQCASQELPAELGDKIVGRRRRTTTATATITSPSVASTMNNNSDNCISSRNDDDENPIKMRPAVSNRNNMEAITPIAAATMAAIMTNRRKQRLTFNMVS